MKQIVSLAVDGRIDIEVDIPEGSDIFAARDEALTAFQSANLADMEIIGVHAVNITDENGNLTDY